MELIQKLLKIQKELKAPKSQWNSFGKYHYRNLEDILEAIKPLLDDCVLTISDDIVHIGERYYVKVTAKISDGKDSIESSAFAREIETKTGFDVAQLTGSASTYARKYALNGLFCIDDTKDADGTDKHEPVRPPVTVPTGVKPLTPPKLPVQPQQPTPPISPERTAEITALFTAYTSEAKEWRTIKSKLGIDPTFKIGDINEEQAKQVEEYLNDKLRQKAVKNTFGVEEDKDKGLDGLPF